MVLMTKRSDEGGDDGFVVVRGRLSYYLSGASLEDGPATDWSGVYVGVNGGALLPNGDRVRRYPCQ